MTPDPKVEEFSYISPYNYALNNPLTFIDPDGKKVRVFYMEHAIVGGAVRGGALSYQRGRAKDDIGKTWYQMSTVSFTNPKGEGTMAFGAEAQLIYGGTGFSKRDKTFSDYIKHRSESVSIGPATLSLSFDDSFSLSAGLGAGFSLSSTNFTDILSFSVTSDEASKVEESSGSSSYLLNVDCFTVETIQTTDAEGNVITDKSKGYLILKIPGLDQINTGILMNKVATDKGYMWESETYSKKKKEVQSK